MREPKHTPSEVCDCKPGYVYHCAGPMLPEAIDALMPWLTENFSDEEGFTLSQREGYAAELNDVLERAGLQIRMLRKRRPHLPPLMFSSERTPGVFTAELDYTLLFERLSTMLGSAMANRNLLDRHPAEEPFRALRDHMETIEVELSNAFRYLMDYGAELGLSTPIGAPAKSRNGDDTQHAEAGS